MLTDEKASSGSKTGLRETLAQRWGHLTAEDLKAVEAEIHALVARIQERTGEGREAVEQLLLQEAAFTRHAGERLAKNARHAAGELRDRYNHVQEVVRDSPAQALATAFGFGLIAGLVIGSALRRR
jgi:ElaB/YqjD/DUF883 family membrane-anchored ribosome-binding protein